MELIGRTSERRELKRLENSGNPEFVAVYGRRRVGKTFLIKEYFNYSFTFITSGLARGCLKDQLDNFWKSLLEYGLPKEAKCPANWFDAFDLLKTVVKKSKKSRKVIFIDEMPWMDTQKSKFVSALDRFWNRWASEYSDIMLIVCGSATSWMVKNIIKNRGGLYNRITSRIKLSPFTLAETNDFLKSKKIIWPPKIVAEAYMIVGGIPYYLSLLDRNSSLFQNIDDFFFSENAKLDGEFDELFSSLFRKSSEYVKIVELLGKKKSGYTRQEIVDGLKCKDGGSLTGSLKNWNIVVLYENINQSVSHASLISLWTFSPSLISNSSRISQIWIKIVGHRQF